MSAEVIEVPAITVLVLPLLLILVAAIVDFYNQNMYGQHIEKTARIVERHFGDDYVDYDSYKDLKTECNAFKERCEILIEDKEDLIRKSEAYQTQIECLKAEICELKKPKITKFKGTRCETSSLTEEEEKKIYEYLNKEVI